MAKVISKTIRSIYDDLPLGVTIMEPEGTPKGILQIAHGMCEYKERYADMLRYICDQGYICAIHDHRGHGMSVRSKADLGYFYDDSGTFIVEDLHEIIGYMKAAYPDLPFYLLGHSMGSLVVRAYTKKYDYELDGLIVCGSPSKNTLASLGKGIVKLMIKCKGDRYRSPFIQMLALGSYERKFHEDSRNAWICSQKHVVEAYDQDPYCSFQFTLNGFLNLFSLMITVYDEDHWIMRNQTLPILFLAGDQDPCIVSEKKFEQAVHFMKQVGYAKVLSKLYHGKRHEILNEDIKEQVYDDICAWMDEDIRKKKENDVNT